MSETFVAYERVLPNFDLWQEDEGGYYINRTPYIRHEFSVRFYWTLAHPASGYYFDGDSRESS